MREIDYHYIVLYRHCNYNTAHILREGHAPKKTKHGLSYLEKEVRGGTYI